MIIQDIQIRLGSEMDHPLLGDFSLVAQLQKLKPRYRNDYFLDQKNMPYSNVLSIVRAGKS